MLAANFSWLMATFIVFDGVWVGTKNQLVRLPCIYIGSYGTCSLKLVKQVLYVPEKLYGHLRPTPASLFLPNSCSLHLHKSPGG